MHKSLPLLGRLYSYSTISHMGAPLTILGVDSNKRHRDLYLGWLGADHDVRTVADGKAAIEAIGSGVDLVLLGRELDDVEGRQIAREIDARVHDCHIVMVSATGADFDIVEYPIDSFVRKPLEGPDLDEIIQQYRTQQRYQSALEEYFRLTSKLGAIEAELSEEELIESDRYRQLRHRVEEKRAQVDEAISETETDWNFAFKSCARAAESEAISPM